MRITYRPREQPPTFRDRVCKLTLKNLKRKHVNSRQEGFMLTRQHFAWGLMKQKACCPGVP